jgi:hypothetical protein
VIFNRLPSRKASSSGKSLKNEVLPTAKICWVCFEVKSRSSKGRLSCCLAVGAQQPDRVRRIGVLLPYAETDHEAQSWFAAFREALTLGGRKAAISGSEFAGAPVMRIG